ncbi:MAG: sigma 54-interacting transcriptional regulator [bacterium]|nr:sigma 54-interacting transcriptional regulator [bacterium]MDT8365097.1 sigma 54-interacting transcriptional regulator [bacterium]
MPNVKQILAFDKENLLDILHYLAKEIAEVTDRPEVRLYIEDMRGGALNCLYTPEGELERKGARIPIQRRDNTLVKSYLESKILDGIVLGAGTDDLHREWYARKKLVSSAIFPLLDAGRSVGVLSVDSSRDFGEVLTNRQREEIRLFLGIIMPTLARAHRFNQKMMLNRHLDRLRKRDAARVLLQGGFEMDLSLDISSVLVSAVSPIPEVLRSEHGGYMEVLAAASKSSSDLQIYETLERISIEEGKSLLSRLVMQDGDRIIRREGTASVLFLKDILTEEFERWEVFNKLALKTLLMIPVEDENGEVICVVNYFTKRPHRYSESEIKLLTGHARTLSEGISDVVVEHFEIRVLSEIEQLLAEDTELPVFLGKVVSRAVELAGADSGSLALVRERDHQRWLVVEDEDGQIVGARSHVWRKGRIPLLRVGGEELPPEHRSLTGYVAFTGKPYMCADTEAEIARGGFYRDLAPDIRSELAVPIMTGDNVIGVINLDSHKKNYFGTEHQGILQLISRLISSRIGDYLKIAELRDKVERLHKEVSYKDPGISSYLLGNIIGKSPSSLRLVERISRLTVPLTNRLVNWKRGGEKELDLGLPTLLITGETGVGKEFVFNNLYSLINQKYREDGRVSGELSLRKTNIAAFTGELTYTELFGHRRGSYTGAHADRVGILEEADGGVVFLDEIGDADLKTQVQLLRFLDSGDFSRLGESRMRRSRVIFVAATNKDLAKEISRGAFREDLYHRLSEMTLRVPPLRERREDIPDLAKHFLGRLHVTYGLAGKVPVLTGEAEAYLKELGYPGNIRQLITVLQGALFESSGSIIGREEIGRFLALGREEEKEDTEGFAGIYGRIRQGEGDFWDLVHGPFMERDLTRQTVLEIYRMAHDDGNGVRGAARLLRALPEGGVGEEAALTRFRNFMYKTVGLGKKEEGGGVR